MNVYCENYDCLYCEDGYCDYGDDLMLDENGSCKMLVYGNTEEE